MDSEDHRNLDGFIDDVRSSQRNIVFPDTVRNARSVDAFLWKGSPNPSLLQTIGALLFGLTFLGLSGAFFWMAAQVTPIHSMDDVLGVSIFGIGAIGFFLAGILTCRNGFPRG